MGVTVGNFEKGKKIFITRCGECHNLDNPGRDKSGSNLNGFMGRMSVHGFVWTPESFVSYVGKKKKVPADEMTHLLTFMQEKFK